jgi:hypothetical protein
MLTRAGSLFALLLLAPSASATTITHVIDLEITFSVDTEIPIGSYPSAGWLTFDDAGLTGSGQEFTPALDLAVTLGAFSTGPYVASSIFATFEDGVLTELDGSIEGPIGVFFGLIEPDVVHVMRTGGPAQTTIGTYSTSPVPEPTTGALVLVGLCGVVGARRLACTRRAAAG